jgi:hypothetical protein
MEFYFTVGLRSLRRIETCTWMIILIFTNGVDNEMHLNMFENRG